MGEGLRPAALVRTNPYAAPKAQGADLSGPPIEYAGFWLRTGAAMVDALLIIGITYPVLWGIYGSDYFDFDNSEFIAGPADFLIAWVAPAVATLWFWRSRQATPGKLLFSLRVVDAASGEPMSLGQSVIRYLGYFASLIPAGLGYVWIAIDPQKQGWHDKLARSVVIRARAAAKDE